MKAIMNFTRFKQLLFAVGAVSAISALIIQLARAEFVTIAQAKDQHAYIAKIQEKSADHFESRLERIEAKIDRIVSICSGLGQ